MMYYVLKVAVTAILVVAISEVAKRSTFVGGLLASLPLVSLLAIVWLYADSQDTAKVAAFAHSVFWLVLPSLALFISLPWFLKAGVPFYPALLAAVALTIGAYFAMVFLLRGFGVSL